MTLHVADVVVGTMLTVAMKNRNNNYIVKIPGDKTRFAWRLSLMLLWHRMMHARG